MAGKICAGVVLVVLLGFAGLLGVTYRLQLEEQERVDRLSTDFLRSVRVQEELNEALVEDLELRLERVCSYQVSVNVKRQVIPGVHIVAGDCGEIKKGDRILLNVRSRYPGICGRFLVSLGVVFHDDDLYYVQVQREVTV